MRGEPVYAPGAGFDPATKTGRFQLAPDSPGAGAGQAIPNFSDGFTGKAPDIGRTSARRTSHHVWCHRRPTFCGPLTRWCHRMTARLVPGSLAIVLAVPGLTQPNSHRAAHSRPHGPRGKTR